MRTGARPRSEPFPKELRDKYYFLDYLRLHRFGKQKGIWKKNRNMLVKEHEYSDDSTIRARKGYKSYIQRCMKSILDSMYQDFTIIKPRNRFSYEIGKRTTGQHDIINVSQENEEKIKFIIQRYLMNGEYEDLVTRYRNLVSECPMLSFKNQEAGIIIMLDNDRSFGYQAVKALEGIRICQDAMITAANDKDAILKDLINSGLEKCRTLLPGTRIQLLGNDGTPQQTFGRVDRFRVGTNSTRGSDNTVEITWDDGERDQMYINQVVVIRDPSAIQAPVPGAAPASRTPLMDRVLEYARNNFNNSSGINSDAIFRLARAAVIRELVNENNMHAATELRRLEPNSEILNSIGATHEAAPDYDDEDECPECGYPEDDCHCCGNCGTYPCCCPDEEELQEDFEL